MKYDWADYTSEYKETIDAWLDEEAKRFTGCDEGFEAYYQYWIDEKDTKPGENFWVKIIMLDDVPVGVIVVGLWEGVFTISEFIIRPDRRGVGLGSSALIEFLALSINIIGIKINDARAVIFPNNAAAQKAFENAGFIFLSENPDGDAWNYQYIDHSYDCGHN